MRYRIAHLPPDFVPPEPVRARRRPGRPHGADVIEAVRVLVEGTTLSLGATAFQTGVGYGSVHGWMRRRGWRRPSGSSVNVRTVDPRRAAFPRRLRLAFARLERLAERAALDPDAATAARARELLAAVYLAAEPDRAPGAHSDVA